MNYWWTYKVGIPYYNLKHFFINVWKFRTELSEARGWDYHGILSLMKAQLKEMEQSQRLHSNHVTCQDSAKEIRTCIHLIERIIEDDYLKMTLDGDFWNCKWNFKYDLPKGEKYCIRQPDKLKKQDLELLTNILRRKLFTWWS